ncbi:MAG: hypothetical protein J7L77_09585 [Clostridiales bacterium]|nr:hypothetical protein [Clostridiales bacterium]
MLELYVAETGDMMLGDMLVPDAFEKRVTMLATNFVHDRGGVATFSISNQDDAEILDSLIAEHYLFSEEDSASVGEEYFPHLDLSAEELLELGEGNIPEANSDPAILVELHEDFLKDITTEAEDKILLSNNIIELDEDGIPIYV